MNVDFETSLAFVWQPQNDGRKDDSAPGEKFATTYGVTLATWSRAVGDGIVYGDINDATKDECEAIFRAYFWNASGCPSILPGIDLMVFNDAVVTGTGHAVRLLQRIVGAAQDGVVGPQTLRLAGTMSTKVVIDQITAGDEVYYRALRNAPLYLNGWLRRERDAQQAAYRLAGITGAPA